LTCGHYNIANLTENELQKLKESERSLNILPERQGEQEIVLIAYSHGKHE
jgi:hypothetical protein